MTWLDESDDVQVFEPILAKKDCRLKITFAEPAEWTVKAEEDGGAPGYSGKPYKAAKLTLQITDTDVQTEHEGASPRLNIDHQFNVEKYPYRNKKTGELAWLGRQALFQIEEAFGFDPLYVDASGTEVPPHVTRTGRKTAPKGDNIKRRINPDFAAAYFHADGTVAPDNWLDKEIYADIGVEESERFGPRNVIKRFKPAPSLI